MDLDALKSTLEQAGPASVAIGFAAGGAETHRPAMGIAVSYPVDRGRAHSM